MAFRINRPEENAGFLGRFSFGTPFRSSSLVMKKPVGASGRLAGKSNIRTVEVGPMKNKAIVAIAFATLLLSSSASSEILDRENMISTAGADASQVLVSSAFGSAGLPQWTTYIPPSDLSGRTNAGEPTLGIPFDTDSVFYKARSYTYRVDFDDGMVPAGAGWETVDPLFLITDVDPMLHADPVSNRIWTGGLDGPCSLMAYSDDNGESWLPTGNMCSGAQFDHQTLGSGPFADPTKAVAYDRVMHYCGQLVLTSCASSYDGGVTWTVPLPVQGACGGLHGHVRVSEATGTAIVPHRNCGNGKEGFAVTINDGLTWSSVAIQDSPGDTQFDPSAQFSVDSGWLYFGDATRSGAYIGMSKDEGATWETIGTNNGDGSAMFNVGALMDPPVVVATFADVQAGDDDRAVFSFIGLQDTDGDGLAEEFGDPHNNCDDAQTIKQWHYYVAMTYDAGQTWAVQKMTTDPVQIGAVYSGQNSICRNLLDFNDLDIDSEGRVHIAWSDGCIDQCVVDWEGGELQQPTGHNSPAGYRAKEVRILRQTTGNGLFSAFDSTPPVHGVVTLAPDNDGDGIVNEEDEDIDGDGIENVDDEDIDGDGIENVDDEDIDGDGIENVDDEDIDGDGIVNEQDNNTLGIPPGDEGFLGLPGPSPLLLAGALAAIAFFVRRRN
jgi:hypothetical protein